MPYKQKSKIQAQVRAAERHIVVLYGGGVGLSLNQQLEISLNQQLKMPPCHFTHFMVALLCQ
jgi:hypothetical protein